MKLLLDTHAFIWWDSEPGKLSVFATRAVVTRAAGVCHSPRLALERVRAIVTASTSAMAASAAVTYLPLVPKYSCPAWVSRRTSAYIAAKETAPVRRKGLVSAVPVEPSEDGAAARASHQAATRPIPVIAPTTGSRRGRIPTFTIAARTATRTPITTEAKTVAVAAVVASALSVRDRSAMAMVTGTFAHRQILGGVCAPQRVHDQDQSALPRVGRPTVVRARGAGAGAHCPSAYCGSRATSTGHGA